MGLGRPKIVTFVRLLAILVVATWVQATANARTAAGSTAGLSCDDAWAFEGSSGSCDCSWAGCWTCEEFEIANVCPSDACTIQDFCTGMAGLCDDFCRSQFMEPIYETCGGGDFCVADCGCAPS